MIRPNTMNYCDIYCDIEDRMKTEEIMKDIAYNYKLTERDDGHLWDIFRTFMGHLFTYIFNPCASASSAQSAFYPMDNKPQRAQRTQRQESILCSLCVLCGGLILSIAKDFDKTTHRKGRKEREAA